MGDSSSARNATGSGEDVQYEADLEMAKRLSMESFESEKRRRNVNNGSISFQPTQKTAKAWTRANSCATQPEGQFYDGQNANNLSSSSSQGNSNSGPGIILPPPNPAIKRHRSLPHRGRGQSQDGGGDPSVGDGSSPGNSSPPTIIPPTNHGPANTEPLTKATLTTDDLISLASPLNTPKFSKRDTSVNDCDSLFGPFSAAAPNNNSSNGGTSNGFGDFNTSPMSVPSTNVFPLINSGVRAGSSNSTGLQQPSIYPSIPAPLPLNSPPNTGPPIGFNIQPSNGFAPMRNSIPPVPLWNSNGGGGGGPPNNLKHQSAPPPTFPPMVNKNDINNSNVKGASAPQFPMWDDLIDLGQFDSKKILQFFDPLSSSTSEQPTNGDRDSSQNENLRNGGNRSSPPITSKKSPQSERTSVQIKLPSEVETPTDTNISGESTPSTSTASQRNSLYPDLSGAIASGTLTDAIASGSFSDAMASFRSESPYTTLHKELMECEESSIYDAYDPLEYLFAVSCSTTSSTVASEFYYAPNNDSRPGSSISASERSIGFSHYYPDSTSATDPIPPALPPRNQDQQSSEGKVKTRAKEPEVQRRVRNSTMERGKGHRESTQLYENLSEKQFAPFDSEIQAFYEMLREIRLSCRHIDSTTNKGYILSPTFPTKTLTEGFGIKIKVWNESFTKDPVSFVCDVSALVEHVLEQSMLDLGIPGSGRDFMLKVHGLKEYLCPTVPISDLRYVQECIKLDQDIKLVLVNKQAVERKNWARTPRDDSNCLEMDVDAILPGKPPKAITYSDIYRFLEVIATQAEKIRETLSLKGLGGGGSGASSLKESNSLALNTAPLIQPVKGVCVFLGSIQTVDVKNSLDLFSRACDEWNSKLKSSSPVQPSSEPRRRLRACSDVSSHYSVVDLDPATKSSSSSARSSGASQCDDPAKEFVWNAVQQVEESVKIMVEMYSKSFPVSFRMNNELSSVSFKRRQGSTTTADMADTFLLRVGAVHRLRSEWLSTYMDYFVMVEMYHGSTLMVHRKTNKITPSKSDQNLFFTSLFYDSWEDFEHIPLCILPRECRLVFTLFGRRNKAQQDEKGDGMEEDELGWASIQCFNFKGQLVQGNYILPFWPKGLVQKRLGPAPNPMTASDSNASLISIEFRDCEEDIYFPEIPSAVPFFRDFTSLDDSTQQMLKNIIENCTFTKFPAEDWEILWEKRHYLHQFPNALPKVLLSARLWDYASLAEIHAMLRHWAPMAPIDALQLLLPCFPDGKVREQAITWISQMDNEELVNMLPQLIEALSFETFDFSPLSEFLLRKTLSCLKISHAMFWLLASQVGLGRWVNESEGVSIISTLPQQRDSPEVIFDPKRRRLELMLNSVMISCGAQWRSALVAEYRLIEILSDVATQVKNASSSSRNEVLVQELHKVDVLGLNGSKSFPLPLSPSYDIRGIDVSSCHSFSSASVPIKVNFFNALPEGGTIPVLFKKGDDLRQDLLTIQVIRLIEKWWLKEGLDFRVLTFSCVPTGYKQGVVEMVPNSETLCKIQAEYGLTGVFQNKPIADWLAKMNPNTVDYKRAVENFTVTCAAYCVLTYVLGICDRHNDNIMLTTSGHMFHIDFGKFLGDVQRFGTFKRDRTPFVLTSDMAYVINNGKSPHNFPRFVELCCQAFRIVRHNGNVLVNLFAMMATAGIPGVDLKSVAYIQRALLPNCSNAEAAARFTRFIELSLGNWFTPWNFFLHSLGQFKFMGEAQDNPSTLSFVQKTFSIEEDGRIVSVCIKGYKKKYDPEKYYSYMIEVRREAVAAISLLNRSYKEFLEFYGKLCINFPMIVSNLKHLPKGPGLGRSNVKQVADKRKTQLQDFLDSLFQLAPEVSHSTLVYTFFHPLLRDEEHGDIVTSPTESLMLPASRIHGEIKLSLEYVRSALLVLVLHAVDLTCPNGQPPSPYVKTYLIPDNARVTKRKTRVVRKSQFPTFMEMIEYRLPLEIIRQKTLQVSVWHYDPLQENNYLGGVAIPLSALAPDKETVVTYPLGNINLSIS